MVVVILLLMVSIYQVLMMVEMRMLVNICKYPHMTTVVGSGHLGVHLDRHHTNIVTIKCHHLHLHLLWTPLT